MKRIGFLVSLILISSALYGGELIRNVDFSRLNDKGLPQDWTVRNSSKSAATVSVSNGILTLHGGDNKEVLLAQFNLPLQSGRKYWVAYQVKADQPGNHRVYCQYQEIKDSKPAWKSTDGNWKPVTAEWQNIRFPLDLPRDAKAPYIAINATGNAKVSFRNLSLEDEAIKVVPANDLAVFDPAKPVIFMVKNPAATADIIYKIIDFEGNEQEKGTLSTLPESQLTLTLMPGYYELQTNEPVSQKLTFAVIPPPDTTIDPNRNQFGAMVAPHTTYPMWERERDAQFMQRIGMRWVRTHRLNWIQVQKNQNKPFNWTEADAEVAIYQRYGLNIVATTCWPTPAWASSGANNPSITSHMRTLMTPAEKYIPQLQKFCNEMATRYQGKIGYYEVGNEVDAINFWQGSAEHSLAGDKSAIIKDFADYFTTCAKAIRQGDPQAKIAPNTTGAVPEGHSYKPWLESFYRFGGAKEMNVFSTHYMADMDAIRKVMKKHDKEVDIIFTEIGGLVRTEKNGATMENFRKIIKISYVQLTTQLSKNGKALCKFLLRDIRGVNEGWIAGILDENFRIRPEYVAYATLIRMLADTEPVKELNITANADAGWAQGFAFNHHGKQVNVIMLQDAPNAVVTLATPDSEVFITDVMGRCRTIKAVSGKIILKMEQEMPQFVNGTIQDNPSPVAHPQPKLVKGIKLNIANGGFEKIAQPNQIPDWRIMCNEIKGEGTPESFFSVFTDTKEKTEGKQSLCTSATQRTGWWGVIYPLPMELIPSPGIGQYVEFIIKYDFKAQNINGIGSGVTLAFRKKDMHRVDFGGGNWERGTFDWSKKTLILKYDKFHPETERITLEFCLGQSTGTSWHDNVEITVNLWQKCGAESREIN